MSDLANSCEYLTNEKLCLAVLESEKARTARQARCKNDEKTTCCYLCMLVLDCASPCKFLGSSENVPLKTEKDKTSIENAAIAEEQEPREEKMENAPVTFCSGCNVEMAKTRTKFRVDGCEELNPLEETLPVIVYLCPKCGKIELRADEKLKKN